MLVDEFMLTEEGDPEVSHIRKADHRKASKILKFNERKIKEAQLVCHSCPVRQECLDSATPSERYWTVRGGEPPTLLQRKRKGLGVAQVPSAGSEEFSEYTCPKGHVGDSNRRSRTTRRDGREYVAYYCHICESGKRYELDKLRPHR